ncbi:hypothetical protein [Methylobacterium sp. Gmos1]
MAEPLPFLGATGPALRRSVIDPETGNVLTGPQTPAGALDYLGAYADLVGSRIRDAATAPARIYRGEIPIFDPNTGHVSDEAMGAGAGIAGLAMTGSLPARVPAGAIRSFGGAAAKEDPLAALEAALAGFKPEAAPPSLGAAKPAPGYDTGPRQPVRVDPEARLWDLYHGSKPGEDFRRFDPNLKTNSEAGAVFFAPEPNAAATYAGSPGVEGFEAGPRIFRTTVEPGKSAVFDIAHLAETDPAFNAQARSIYAQEAGPRAGALFDRYLSDFQTGRARDREIADQVRAMGFDPASPQTGVSFGYGHIGAAIARAKEQGLDTAVLRGLAEHGGDDQVVALTPNRVRSYYAPDQLLYAGTPLGAGVGASLAAPGDRQPLPFLGTR